MDHLNIFNAYKNKANHHEDELTRTFLTLVKNIPAVQTLFFEKIRQELCHVPLDEPMPSIALGDFAVRSIHTQVGNTNAMFSELDDYKVLSVIISDDRLEEESKVINSERNAVYDGVIFADPGWLIIIENKPSRDNIWLEQLNPALKEEANIIERPCALSWRDLIERLNMLIINKVLTGLELKLVEDFLQFVDQEFSNINPYTRFNVCKDNDHLLEKRCVDLLNQLIIDGEQANAIPHRGWKYYVNSNRRTVKQIALGAEVTGDDWSITLYLYAGDTMSSSKITYNQLNYDQLLKLREYGFTMFSNFHLSYRSSNLFWSAEQMPFERYVEYWLQHAQNLKQIKREQFEQKFVEYEQIGLTSVNDRNALQEKILDKKYPTLNICPGFGILFTWTKEQAIALDDQNQFLPDLKEKIQLAFEALGDRIELG